MTETRKRHKRLFARLMVEECVNRDPTEYYDLDYFQFLRSQRNTKNKWCPYNLACRSING